MKFPGRSEKSKHFRLGRCLTAPVAAILIAANLVLTAPVFAHNIDLEAAWEKARDYARAKRSDPGRTYKHSTDCVEAFPGHNHYVRCTISYQNEGDTARGRQTCTERIEVYLWHHVKPNPLKEFQYPDMYIKNTSKNQC